MLMRSPVLRRCVALDIHARGAQHPMKRAADARLSAIGYRLSAIFISVAVVILASGCGITSANRANDPSTLPTTRTPSPVAATLAQVAPIAYNYQVVKRYPHNTTAFTEGLVYVGDDTLYEGTGLYGQSSLREVQLSTGQVAHQVNVSDPTFFGEGVALVGDTIFQLSWQNCVGFLYHRIDFTQYGQFHYPQASGGSCAMEGWGLTYDGAQLIMSDGTSTLSFIDPVATITSGTLAIMRRVQVTLNGNPVHNLNELEYINGSVFANVWMTNTIMRIDPATGQVTGTLDLSGLLNPPESGDNVLNGIAYDATGNRLFVTGKRWPALFEITLVPPLAYRLHMPLVAS